MISKKLLSEVLGVYVYEVDFEQNNRVYFKFTSIEGSTDYQVDNINIHDIESRYKDLVKERKLISDKDK